MAQYCIGVDLGGTNIKAGLVDQDANVLCKFSVPTGVEKGTEHVVSTIVGAAKRAVTDAGVRAEDVIGVGIGSPGPMSHRRGLVINPGNLPCMKNVPLRAEVVKHTGFRATLENDANAAAWGEYWAGAGKGVRDMVMFTLGTGVGGGVIAEGNLLRGHFENGGELGHIIVQPGGRRCSCNQLGCVEAYSSASNLAARMAEEIKAGKPSSLKAMLDRGEEIRAEHVDRAAQAGDKLAGQVWDDACRYLAIACVVMQHTTNPQRIVFAGGMINAGPPLLDRVRKHFHAQTWNLLDDFPEIMFATLGDDAGLIGAAGCALRAHETGDW
jgi:glucokinase